VLDLLGTFNVGAANGDGIHSGAKRGEGGLDGDLGTILAMMAIERLRNLWLIRRSSCTKSTVILSDLKVGFFHVVLVEVKRRMCIIK